MLDRQADQGKKSQPDDGRMRAEHNLERDEKGHIEAQEAKRAPATPPAPPRRRRSPLPFIIILLLVLGFGYGGYSYWLANKDFETTDDAYTDGRMITIAPEVTGKVVSLDINDNQFVKAGQPIVHIDDRQYQIDRESAEGQLATARAQLARLEYAEEVAKKNFPALYDAARARLVSAQATLVRAEADYKRQQGLPRQATTQQEVDAATAAYHQAQAQVAQAQADVKQAEPVQQNIDQVSAQIKDQRGQVEQAQARLDQALLNLSRCVVVAPQDGWIAKRNVEKGNYVSPGQQLVTIVSPQIWVTANFKETQLTLMRPGQPVTIEVDAYPDLHLEGHVDSFQPGSGSKFQAFPPENATGNFVKIVQRVPVKIAIDKGLDPKLPLPLGISVVPRVKVQ